LASEVISARARPLAAAAAGHPARFALFLFAGLAVVIFVWQQASVAFIAGAPIPGHGFPDYPFFDGWVRWDSDWYIHIARLGYFYDGPGKQSAVAYFPGYPAAMRVVMFVVRDALVAGVLVTYAAGLTTAVLFWRWSRAALGAQAARLAVVVLLVHPFAFFLFGAVYSDALFLAAALAAFIALEHDRPWLAGLAGMVATAARPVGVAVTIALVVRALEIRGVIGGGPPAFRGTGDAAGHRTPLLPRTLALSRLRGRDAGVLLSLAGLGGYLAFLWNRFGDPLAFTRVYSAVGWARTIDVETAFKSRFFWLLRHGGFFDAANMALTLQGFLTVLMLVLVPVVVRRLGWGYGLYALIVILMPVAGSAEFLGMGRYTLAAFPCYAVGGALLARRPPLAAVWVTLSLVGLGVMSSCFARWYLYS
jgi:hypothetical protein